MYPYFLVANIYTTNPVDSCGCMYSTPSTCPLHLYCTPVPLLHPYDFTVASNELALVLPAIRCHSPTTTYRSRLILMFMLICTQ